MVLNQAHDFVSIVLVLLRANDAELFLDKSSDIMPRPALPCEYLSCRWMVSVPSARVVSDPETSLVCGNLGQVGYADARGVMWYIGGRGASVAECGRWYVGEGGDDDGSSTLSCEVRVRPNPTRTMINVGTMPYFKSNREHYHGGLYEGCCTYNNRTKGTKYDVLNREKFCELSKVV